MGEWTATRGSLPAILTGRLIVVVDGEGSADAARRVLSALTARSTLVDVLDAIVAGGIAAAPSFFVGELDGDDLVAMVRGDLRVEVETGGGGRSVDAADARTWQEISVTGLTSLGVAGASWPFAVLPAAVTDTPARLGPLEVARLRLAPAPVLSPPPTPAPADAPAPSDDPMHTLEFSEALADELAAAEARQSPRPLARSSVTTDAADPLSRYDDLFGSTVNFGVEAAAVRADAEDPDGDEPAGPVVPGILILPDGSQVPIAGVLLVGRNPRSPRGVGSGVPTLVPIDDRDVSRTHARIRVEGDQVLVEDLGSTNGTVLVDADGTTHRLTSGEPAPVTAGMIAELGGGPRVAFRARTTA